MSEYKEFLNEKNKLDELFDEGYIVKNINENLSGMYIEFSSPESVAKETVMILLMTTEARKYISTKLFYASVSV